MLVVHEAEQTEAKIRYMGAEAKHSSTRPAHKDPLGLESCAADVSHLQTAQRDARTVYRASLDHIRVAQVAEHDAVSDWAGATSAKRDRAATAGRT
jgi:hypothetical protein